MEILYSVIFLIYSLILLITYFSKSYNKKMENKTYSILLIINVIGLILEVLKFVVIKYNLTISFNIISKIYQIYLLSWMGTFSLYAVVISNNYNNDDNKMFGLPFMMLFYFLSIIAVIILPSKVIFENNLFYSNGASTNYLYFCCLIYTIIIAFNLFKNIYKIYSKKYYPIYLFFVLGVLLFIVKSHNPEFIQISYILSLITMLIYFTIENPDFKLIKELNYSRLLADKTRNSTVDILNNMKYELKDSLTNLVDFGYIDINNMSSEQMNHKINNMRKMTLALNDKISNLIEIGKIESDNYSLNKEEYNPNELLLEINEFFNNKKDVNGVNIKENIFPPINNILYGDPLKIKQIILHAYNYIIEKNKKGSLQLKIEHKIVGNLCRLKFYFICKNKKQIEYNDASLDYQIIIKLLDLMNGNIDIKYIDNEITELQIILDQKIISKYDLKNENMKYISKKLKNYYDASNKRIIIFDDNREKISTLKNILEPTKADISIVNTIDELVYLLGTEKTYDLIIIDDIVTNVENNTITNEEILKTCNSRNLKKLFNYEIPVIILVTKNNKKLEEKYLKMGFSEFIIKPITYRKVIKKIQKVLK